jgi:hypothetical protein
MFYGRSNSKYIKKLHVPNKEFIPKVSSIPNIEPIFSEIEMNIKSLPLRRRQKQFNLTHHQYSIIKQLRANPNLIVINTDKNLGPALVTTSQYNNLCYEHLGHPNTYEVIINTDQNTMKAHLINLVQSFYNRIEYDLICSNQDTNHLKIIISDINNKRLNYFYGLLKIHKKQLCIRPIVSNSNSFLEGLSKWLDYHLQSILCQQDSYIRDSDTLVNEIRILPAQSAHILYTFDVVSLYTNIKTDKALRFIRQIIPISNPLRDFILQGLKIVMDNNYFMFNNLLYKQITGTAMGTASAPCYASLFLSALERPLVRKYSNIVFYKRFIDDGLLIWENTNEFTIDDFLNDFTKRSDLLFTYEKSDSKIQFLDIEIIKDNKRYISRSYQKTLNLFLYTASTSAHPSGVLKSLVYGRIKKFYFQNDNHTDFIYFVTDLFQHLLKRGYTRHTLLPLFKNAYDKAINSTKTNKTTSDNSIFLKIPFDPNGLSNKEIRHLFKTVQIEDLLEQIDINKVTLCYTKPSSLDIHLKKPPHSTPDDTNVEESRIQPNN